MSLEAAGSSEKSVNFHQATRHLILEYSDLHEYSNVFSITSGLTVTTQIDTSQITAVAYFKAFIRILGATRYSLVCMRHAFCQHYL
jgi:hypothetical protein